MSARRMIWMALWLALAAVSLFFFVTRYWLHRACIEAAASSCITPEGDNLTSGGMFWGLFAIACIIAAALAWRRKA